MAASTATSDFSIRSDDLSLQYKVDAAINEAMSRGDPDLAVNMAQTHINSFGNEEIRSMLDDALSKAGREEDRQRLEAYQSKLRKRYMPGIKHKKAYVRNTYQYAGLMRLLMRLRQEGKAKTEQRVAEKLAMDLQREYSDGPVSAAEGRVEDPHKGTEDKANAPTPLHTSSDNTSTACHSGIVDAQVNEAVNETTQCPRLAQHSEVDPVIEDDLVYSPPKVMTVKPVEHHENSAKAEVLVTGDLPSSPPIPCVEVHTPTRAEPPQKCEIQHLDPNWGERWYCIEHSITLCTARQVKRHRRDEGGEEFDSDSDDDIEVAQVGLQKSTPPIICKKEPKAVMTEPRKRRYDINGILLPETAEEKELVKRYMAKKMRSDRRFERAYGIRKRRYY